MLRNSLFSLFSPKFLALAIAATAAIAVAPVRPTQAAVLGTENFTTEGGAGDVFTSFHPTLAIAPAVTGRSRGGSTPATGAPLFQGTSITPDDVGRTFTVSEATDANFKDFTANLTDGKPEKITLSFGSGEVRGSELSISKSGNLFGGQPDLKVNTIDSIDFRVNSLTLDTPGTNPNGDGVWTNYSFDGTVSVNGQPIVDPPALSTYSHFNSTPVPEPSSAVAMLMFSLCATGGFFRKLRAKKRFSIVVVPK
jgi:hypothetical protein